MIKVIFSIIMSCLEIDVSSILNGLITDRNGNFNISVYNGYGDFVSNQNYFIDKRNFKALWKKYELCHRVKSNRRKRR